MHMGGLIFEGLWIITPRCEYMNEILVHIEFKNDSDYEILISSVVCSFQVEDDLPRHEIKSPSPISIPPGNRKPLTMRLEIGLELRYGTNSPTVEVEYASGRSESETTTFSAPGKYLDIQRVPPLGKRFFISHKIPEDTELAERLNYYLQKVGFDGYIAEGDPLLGHDLWTEKIFPAIDSCAGLIILWTAEAEKDPESICREIERAKEKGKKPILLREENACVPDGFQVIEHTSTTGKTSESDLVRLAYDVYRLHMRGYF